MTSLFTSSVQVISYLDLPAVVVAEFKLGTALLAGAVIAGDIFSSWRSESVVLNVLLRLS
jgi:hypothetical protein